MSRWAPGFFLWWHAHKDRWGWLFAPLSLIWAAACFLRHALYDARLLPISRVNRPVVSVGNVVAGGTGKTPLVVLLAQTFSHRNVAILSRGYGAIPDEALLLQRRLPKARVYVGKDRVALARRAVREGAQLILLDDGMQHRRLHRDFDLALVSGSDPLGGGRFLPWGFLRDTPRRLKRVDALFVSGKQLPLKAITVIPYVNAIFDLNEEKIDSIRGWKVAIFSGIAKPASFKKTVVDLGAYIVDEWVLADHEPTDEARLKAYCIESKRLGAKALVCTEKDFVKIDVLQTFALPIVFIEIAFRVVGGEHLWEKLIAKIDQKIDNISA